MKPVIGNFTGNRLTDNRITTLVKADTDLVNKDMCEVC